MKGKLVAAAMVGLFIMSTTGCALVGAGAGRNSDCRRIAGLARTGEHKPAVDSYDTLVKSGHSCSEGVGQRVSRSRSRVGRADNYVRKAFQRRKEGNLLSAKANLEEALQIYPNYYWVRNLLKNLEVSIEAEINGLRGEARYLESHGDLSAALKRIGEAQLLAPNDPALKAEAARLQAARGKEVSEMDTTKTLDSAREHMIAGRFDEAEKVLTQGGAANRLGSRGEEMVDEMVRRRAELIDQRFSVAREAEQKGDMDVAASHIGFVLELSRPEDNTTREAVEFARLLGVKLFSAGKLVRAKELWGAAFELDPGNDKLATYLHEVDDRLMSLEKIKGDDGGAK